MPFKEPIPFNPASWSSRQSSGHELAAHAPKPRAERHPGQFYLRSAGANRMVATTLADEDSDTAKANGYHAEITLPDGEKRWRAIVTLRGEVIFAARGHASPDRLIELVQDAIQRERADHLAGLYDPKIEPVTETTP